MAQNIKKEERVMSNFCHSDHLGSSHWMTDEQGQAVQCMDNLPFGEPWIDQQLSAWAAPYTFSGKERDEETGYSYFGARYYDSDLSIWLSVDPLASKYPGHSPYVYCMNNPVKLIDPNGMEVIIGGEAAATYYAEVEKGACALGISTSMDRNGKLSAEYTGQGDISVEGQQFLDAVNSTSVTVNVNATNSDYADGVPFVGGAFMGNELRQKTVGKDDVITTGANAFQTVNPNDLKQMDDFYGASGKSSIHEITEAYQGALISMKNGVASGNSGSPNSVYRQAHNAATPPSCPSVDRYQFDRFGNQSSRSGLQPKSIGFYFSGTSRKIKEVKY